MPTQESEPKIEGTQKEGEQAQETLEKVAHRTAQIEKEKTAAAAMFEEEIRPVSISDERGQMKEPKRLDEFINVEGLADTIRQLDENIRAREVEIAEVDKQLFDTSKFTAGWRRGEREALQNKQNQLKDALTAIRKDRDETRDRLAKFREKSL